MIPQINTPAAPNYDPFNPIAPDQPFLDGGMTIPASPVSTVNRAPVGALVGRLPGRTLDAGSEIGSIPQQFDTPTPLRRLYSALRGGHRRTLLAPELQSELDGAGANVMPQKGMTQPYTVREPGPWYEDYSRQFGS